MRRAARALAVAIALLAPLALGAAPSSAATDGGASVAHVESSGGKIRVLVSVPPGAQVDLGGVTASLVDVAMGHKSGGPRRVLRADGSEEIIETTGDGDSLSDFVE